ncbi:MAG: Fpg/Nei family DNA glycosylase [Vicinamibacterales bacterium]
MPELPDLAAYLAALEPRVVGQPLEAVSLARPFFLRSVDPPLEAAIGRHVEGLRLLGKRIVFALEDDLYLVLHLMIAGRLRWRDRGTRPSRKVDQAAFEFPGGTLLVTEAGSRKQASLHVVRGASLADHDPGGLDVLRADLPSFAEALRRENHTVKRALTDPSTFSGIGNAYSDEILHAARLSPLKLTSALSDDEIRVLHKATMKTLGAWIEKLTAEARTAFPEKVTAFRREMAVHGRFGKPCPACGMPIQRVVFARNEMNYCPSCQTGGRLLADRSLSRLLAKDWPRTLEELERRKRG